MRLRVLGSSPVRPNPDAACTGYLVQAGAQSLLLDCGSGVLGQLLRYLSLPELDAVFISHGHPDHCLDLVNIRQALAYVPSERRAQPLPVYAPAPTVTMLQAIGEVFNGGEAGYWDGYVQFHPVSPDRAENIGDLALRFAWTRHYLPCLALRLEADQKTLVFGADSGPDSGLEQLAIDADLLILEATLLREQALAEDQERGHLSGDEAARLADRAGAARLLLTHYFAELGPRVLAEARGAADLPVDLARQGELHEL